MLLGKLKVQRGRPGERGRGGGNRNEQGTTQLVAGRLTVAAQYANKMGGTTRRKGHAEFSAGSLNHRLKDSMAEAREIMKPCINPFLLLLLIWSYE